MRISVVIPVHNGEAFLAAAIRSALNQTHPPEQVIVVDNGSTDASAEIARGFGPPVRVIAAARQGAAAARVAGAAQASGDAIMFLDADDMTGPDTFEHLARALARSPGAIACCPWRRYELVDGCWRAGPPSCRPRRAGQDDLAAWLSGWYHPPCSVLWSREAYEASGGWDPAIRVNNDGDVMMRALVRDVPLVMSQGGLGYYRRLPGARVSLSGRARTRAGLESRLQVLERLESMLAERGRAGRYGGALARSYRGVLRGCDEEDRADLRARAAAGIARNRPLARLFGAGSRTRPQAAPAPVAALAPRGPAATAARSAPSGEPPLVSVILPTYNRAETVGRAISSVLAQTYGRFELLVVDDGSTDGTAPRVAAIDDGRVRYLRQPRNMGVAAARNRGMQEARGSLIAFLDSDDAWTPAKLERQVARMRQAPARVGLVHTGLAVREADGLLKIWTPRARGHVLAEVLARNVLHFGTSSAMIRAEAAEAVGGFDTGLPANEDHDYWARIARFYEFDFLPEPLTVYDHSNDLHDPTGTMPVLPAKRSRNFANNMRARDIFVERHGFEAARLGALHAYQMDSARRHLEWDEGDVRAGRRLLLKAARARPGSPLPHVWLALSLLPRGVRAAAAARLRRFRGRVAPPAPPVTGAEKNA